MSFQDNRTTVPIAINLDLTVETPENVLLTYQVAGPAVRLLAYMLDSVVRGLILVLVLLLALWSSSHLPGITWGLVLLVMFVLQWGYFIISEGLFRGKTLGKDALGLRVVQWEGYPVNFWAAAQRNLMRAVDGVPLVVFLALTMKPSVQWLSLTIDVKSLWASLLMLPIYGPGLVSMLLTKRFQRLGDLVAGTVVISERQTRLNRESPIVAKIEPLPANEIGPRIPEASTLALIDEFLSRREELTYEQGHDMCAEFAFSMARFLEFQGDPYQLREYPMSFLARVLVTFGRSSQEQPPADDAWTATAGQSLVVASTYDFENEGKPTL